MKQITEQVLLGSMCGDAENRDEILAYNKKYYIDNKKEILVQHKDYLSRKLKQVE